MDALYGGNGRCLRGRLLAGVLGMTREARNLLAFCFGMALMLLPMLAFAQTNYKVVRIYAHDGGACVTQIAEQWAGSLQGKVGGFFTGASGSAVALEVSRPAYGPGGFACSPNAYIAAGAPVDYTSSRMVGSDIEYQLRTPLAGGQGGEVRVWVQLRTEAPPPCESGVRDPQTGQCQVPPCQQGQVSNQTFEVAYRTNTNTSDGASIIGTPKIPTTGCSGQCQVSVGSYAGGCWLNPNVGPPYIVSCNFNTTTTGVSCTSADIAASQPLPQIPCPEGTSPGSVNGVAACYPVSTTSSNTQTTTAPDGTKTTTTETTNPDGSKTTTTTTTSADGSASSTTTTTTPPSVGTGGGGGGESKESVPDACTQDPTKCQKTGEFSGPGTDPEALHKVREDMPTFGKTLERFQETMAKSPLSLGVKEYFKVSASGSCPTWSAAIPYLGTTIVIDQFCTQTARLMLDIAGAALLILAAWAAFRIAIL